MNALGVFVALFLIVIYELVVGLERHSNRKSLFRQAQQQARDTDRPLIIIGDPHRGADTLLYNWLDNSTSYTTANCMIDIDPCDICIQDPNVVKGDMIEELKKYDSDSAVVYVSGVLEYVDDIQQAVNEIKRVAGSYTNIYIVHAQRYSFSSFGYLAWTPEHHIPHHVIYTAPPSSTVIEYKTLV